MSTSRLRKSAEALVALAFLVAASGAQPVRAGGAGSGQQPQPQRLGSPDAEATSALLEGDGERTRFRLVLSRGVTAEIYTLANPYRVVIDLPGVLFRLPAGTGQSGEGLVSAFRYGLFAEGRARIVLDTTAPVRIGRAAMAKPETSASDMSLDVELVRTSPESFGSGTGAGRPHPAPAARPPEPKERETQRGGKPVVLIDPGHGGIDGGAVSPSGQTEKSVVLSVARALGETLAKRGRYEIRFTRQTDVFVSLDRRLAISREVGAELFISLHADAIAATGLAQSIRGATVYTLSGKVSDEEARRMAEKENASDLLAGADIATDEEAGDVKGILIDLLKRETANFSTDFSNVVVRRLGKAIPLARDPQRSAAFKVLRQTHAPSVLIELGYLSHTEDQKLMGTTEWQRRVAGAIADAVDAYFAKRTANTP